MPKGWRTEYWEACKRYQGAPGLQRIRSRIGTPTNKIIHRFQHCLVEKGEVKREIFKTAGSESEKGGGGCEGMRGGTDAKYRSQAGWLGKKQQTAQTKGGGKSRGPWAGSKNRKSHSVGRLGNWAQQ